MRSSSNGVTIVHVSPAASNASLLSIFGRLNMNPTLRPLSFCPASSRGGRYRQIVISAVPSLARLPIRNHPPTWFVASKQLMYIDSLKFGSGPSSCMYSSDGSRRTPMRRSLSPELELLPGERDLAEQLPGEPAVAPRPAHLEALRAQAARR